MRRPVAVTILVLAAVTCGACAALGLWIPVPLSAFTIGFAARDLLRREPSYIGPPIKVRIRAHG